MNQLFSTRFWFMKKQITWKLGKEKQGQGRLFDFFTLSASQPFVRRETTETEQNTKYNKLRESTNPYLQKDCVRSSSRFITSSGSASGCLHDDWYSKKNYAVWHFGLSRTPGNEFVWQFTRSKCDILHILKRTFFVLRKCFFYLLTL